MDINYDMIIIGGGPAGLSAAVAACDSGINKVLIIERASELGGILNQCIHNGFGLHIFKEELTGPEYAQKLIRQVKERNIDCLLDTMVLHINSSNAEKEVHTTSKKLGYTVFKTKAVILAMGCRERTRGAIRVPGDRPSGIFTAGSAQRYINIEGKQIGKNIVILGSGDIGLIMARRLTLEGARVECVLEIMPYSNGLSRNIAQCLDDYDIPLYLSHTVTRINGKSRLESIMVAQVDENRKPIESTAREIKCDTLLLSVGLIPENELSREAGINLDPRTNGPVVDDKMQTSQQGIFACGNVVQVHDLADFVTLESQRTGANAAEYVKGMSVAASGGIIVKNGADISYTVPQIINSSLAANTEIFFRVTRIFDRSVITVISREKKIAAFKREYIVPGELQRITLPKKLLEQCGNTITIQAEEAQEKLT